MILCGIACLVLAVVMILTRTHPMFRNIRSPCALLMCFCVLGILAETAGSMDAGGIASGKLKRKAPGEGEAKTEAYVMLPQEDTEYPISITVEERRYLKGEEEMLIAAAKKEISEKFCGTNTSLRQIISDPIVLERCQNGKVSAEWTFSEETIISAQGHIDQHGLGEDKQKIEAFVSLSCGESEEFYRFSFWVVPKKKSKKEHLLLKIKEDIARQEATEAYVRLPDSIDGKPLRWKETSNRLAAQLFGLGILAAMALAYVKKEQKEKQIQRQKRRLFLSYPDFVSTLSLLLGAGMTISGALRKMNQMYQRKKTQGAAKSEVYEALDQMLCEIDNGMGETRAYQEFANRCGIGAYKKLVSLLTQGQKVGNRRLIEQLQEEAERVFLERKQAARKLGEEAGTKLLLPMMMMLMIVMAIVTIPAFLSMYQK